MAKKLRNFILVCLCLLLLTGCWDYKDIENRSIVTAIGADYERGNYSLVHEILQVKKHKSSNEEGSAAINTALTIGQGKNLEEAEYNRDYSSFFPTFLGAVRVVILGQGLVRKGIEPYMNRINRLFDYRKTTLTVVSRERPEDILKIKTKNDISVGFMVEDMIDQLRELGIGLYITSGDIISTSASGEEGYVLPYIGLEDGVLKFLGFAVLKDFKLVGIINAKDSLNVTYLLAKKPKIRINIPHPSNEKNLLSLMTTVNKRRIKTDYINGNVEINIDLGINAELRYEYTIDPLTDEEINSVENLLSEQLENDILRVISEFQEKNNTDILGFVKNFKADNPAIYKNINWRDEYPHAKINVHVESTLKNLNLFDPNAKKKF